MSQNPKAPLPKLPPLALLAGGKGTRLGRETKNIPKSLVSVAGQPFIHHQLQWLKAEGISHVVICAGHFGEQIQASIGDGSKFRLKVTYSLETKGLLGTGGAIQKALPLLGNLFWILYGDSYLDVSFARVLGHFNTHAEPALLTVFQNQNRWGKSNVCCENGLVITYDKNLNTSDFDYIDYGLSLVRRGVFTAPRQEKSFDLSDIFKALAQKGQLAGYEVQQRFYEIGSPEGLAETRSFLASKISR